MACGAGLYAAAAVATAIVILALEAVGLLERRANLKIYSQVYEARGNDQVRMLESILDAMDSLGQRLTGVEQNSVGSLERVSFSVTASKRQHNRLHAKLITEPGIAKVLTYFDPEED
jgi:putative Mg2+ transporter-C (MgtC) family protein